jgi:RNA polymerase sigma-70 factor, ECF subfamily
VEIGDMPLVRLACAGDKEACWRLVQPHVGGVFWTAMAILGNSGQAEEASQEAILKSLRNIQGFPRETKFRTWLIETTINEARDTLLPSQSRRSGSSQEWEPEDADEYVPKQFTPWTEIPQAALKHKEVRDALQQAFCSLPRCHREIFAVRDIARLSTNEAAQVLGVTQENVNARLLTARLRVRDAFTLGLQSRWCQSKAQYKRAQV